MIETSPEARSPARVPAAETPGLSSLLSLAVAVVAVAALYFAREVLIPITVAVLLCFVLAPLANALQRVRIPHVAAVLLSVLIALAAILAVGGIIGVQVAGIATDVPRYTATVQRKVETVRDMTIGRLSALTERLDKQFGRTPAAAPTTPEAAAADTTPKAQLVRIEPSGTSPVELARAVLAPILDPVENVLIVLIVAVFILMQREDLRDRLIRLFGSSDLHRTTLAMNDAGERLGKYFLAQLGINACFGLVAALGLFAIGVPSPTLWGVTSALLRFVPYIGPVIAALLPAALAAAIEPGWSMALWTLALFVVTESITGQVLEPLIYGHSTGLSPAAVVIAAIFWTWIWGPIGLVLSTPLTLCLVVLGRHVDRLEFFDVMLGDRPALTPVENFYQRMLADDPDEAQHQAELMLKERSLTAYYDEVALKGLQLAANDVLRGALDQARLERIRDNVRSLVEDLSSHADRDPHPAEKAAAEANATRAERAVPKPPAPKDDAPPSDTLPAAWRGDKPVLCLAGKGPLDEAAAAILAQLLGKHGLRAGLASHEAASRRGIATLDLSGVAMICISYLEIPRSAANLHYLVRRLRQRAPGARILVGLWPLEEPGDDRARVQAAIGADAYVANLAEAIETCVGAAQADAGAIPDEASGDGADTRDGLAHSPDSRAALPA